MLASQCCVHIEVGNFNQYLSISGGETLTVMVISILFICVLWSHVKEMALKRLWSGSRGSMADDGSESKKNLNKKIKNTVFSYCQYLLVEGRCWLAFWNCSKHMKIGSYISHSQIWWNLLLIMLLIPCFTEHLL